MRLYETFRVRFAEVDSQAVAFNSRYLEYADIVVTEFCRFHELPITGPKSFEVHVVESTVRYFQPLRFDDRFEGWARVSKIGRSSMTFDIELRLAGQLHPNASITLHYVHVDLDTAKSTVIPDEIRAKFHAI